MKRRSFIRTSTLALSALTIIQQKIFAAIGIDPWKITMLTERIGIFTEKGGTILFLLEKNGITIVDTQFPDSVQHLIDELKKKNEQPFHLIINTHHHGDHSSGNIAFKGMATTVVAHVNSKINQENAARERKNEDKQLYPSETYSDTWCKKTDNEKICLHYFGAAHTNGDSIVHFTNADIAHVGDLVFNRRHPYIDTKAGANIKNWINVLDKIIKILGTKTQFICGHAATGYDILLKPDDIKIFGNYLGAVLAFTEAEIKAGKTKEEIIKATAIPGFPEWKSEGIERPLSAAYSELTSQLYVQ